MTLGLSKLNRRLPPLALALMLILGGAAARGQGAAGGRVVDLNEKGEPVVTTETLRAAASDRPVSSATVGLLRKLEALHKDQKTIHATFQQTRRDAAFDEDVESPGELWFEKPAAYRCDYAKPQELKTLIAGTTFYMYHPELKQVDFWKYESAEERDQQLHQLLIVFGFNADELVRRYDIRSSLDDAALAAELAGDKAAGNGKVIFAVKPRAAYEESCPFKEMKVTVDKTSLLPEKIWYKDPSDSALTLTMKKIELGGILPAGIFDKDKLFPPGVHYIDKRNEK